MAAGRSPSDFARVGGDGEHLKEPPLDAAMGTVANEPQPGLAALAGRAAVLNVNEYD